MCAVYGTLLDIHIAVKRKWPSMLTRGVIILHDNTHTHVVFTVQNMLHSMYWKALALSRKH
jgi:hypothetical protein